MPFYIVNDPGTIASAKQRVVTHDTLGRLWVGYTRDIAGLGHAMAAYSTDGGVTWTEEQVSETLVTPPPAQHQGYPSLAADSQGNIHCVYNGRGAAVENANVVYRKRTADGWQAIEFVSTWVGMGDVFPAIAIDADDNIHVTWAEGAIVPDFVRYRKRLPSGWQAIEQVSGCINILAAAGIAIDLNGNVHITWYGDGFGTFPARRQILYRKRTTVGWQALELITDINDEQYYPAIIVSTDGNVHVVWNGRGWGANPGQANIRYRERDGAGWLAQVGLTDIAFHQYMPSISIDADDNLHVAWYGTGWGANPGNSNIQYRQRLSGVWQAQQGITDRAFNNSNPNLIGALYPRVGVGVSITIPVAGYMLAFTAAVPPARAEVWLSPNLLWPPTTLPTVTTDPATGVT